MMGRLVVGVALAALHVAVCLPVANLAQDEDAFPWGDDQAEKAQVTDMADELRQSTGSSPSMTNTGMGHMVGRNDRQGPKKLDEAEQKLAQDVRGKDDQIAQSTEDLEALRAEEERVKLDLSRVQAAHDRKASELESERQARLAKLLTEEDEHLASVKRETSLQVKHVRVDSETHLEMEKKKLQESIVYEQQAFDQEKAELAAKLAAATARSTETDKAAEEIFQQHRAQWKAKRAAEVAANGVKANIKTIKATTAELRDQFKELEARKAAAKDHLKRAVQDKLLLAAKLKNLHAREDDLEAKQAKAQTANANLKHQLDEVRLTQESNAVAVDGAVGEALSRKAAVVEGAKADAEVAETQFKDKVLSKAEADIAGLKAELAKRQAKEQRTQQELLAQESSVQAELKEAGDGLAKANWDLSVADEQARIELSTARDKSLDLVDEARRKAAAMREHARAKGMHESEAQYREAAAKHAEQETVLKEEEQGVSKLAVEFQEKTAKQIQEREDKMRAEVDAKRRSMEDSLVHASDASVKKFEEEEERQVRDIKRQYEDALQRVDTSESAIRELQLEIGKLQKQQKVLKAGMLRDKTEWTNKQVNAKYPIA